MHGVTEQNVKYSDWTVETPKSRTWAITMVEELLSCDVMRATGRMPGEVATC